MKDEGMQGLYGKIKALTEDGDTDGALALAAEGLRQGDDAHLHYLAGNALMKAGRRTEAMNAYLSASRLDPDSPAAEQLAMWRGIMDFYCKDLYNP